jgi:hypothetical protein
MCRSCTATVFPARARDGNGSGPLNVFGPEQDYTLDTAWHYESEESEGGIHVVVRRDTGDGANYWRISEMILPCFSHAPPYGDEPFLPSNAWVPRDDTSLWRWNIASHPMRPLTADERGAMKAGQGVFAEIDPETLRPLANIDNDYFMDREGQRRGDTFSGIPGVAQQDQSIQESQGLIHQRSGEFLMASDKSIIMMRNRLLAAIKTMQAGGDPPGLNASGQRVRSATLVAPDNVGLVELSKDALRTKLGVALTAG